MTGCRPSAAHSWGPQTQASVGILTKNTKTEAEHRSCHLVSLNNLGQHSKYWGVGGGGITSFVFNARMESQRKVNTSWIYITTKIVEVSIHLSILSVQVHHVHPTISRLNSWQKFPHSKSQFLATSQEGRALATRCRRPQPHWDYVCWEESMILE